MTCPGCGAAMTGLTLDGQVGRPVEIDLCPACQVIWFDKQESPKLSPAGTLQLLRVVGERRQLSPSPLTPAMKCPRCRRSLILTRDRQRNTPFSYWRCPGDHGRLTTFFDFLREKDFVRPLSPPQLAELRAHVQTINCSSCGAPIDLVKASACAQCGAPVSILDVAQIGRMVDSCARRTNAAARSIRRCRSGSSSRSSTWKRCSRGSARDAKPATPRPASWSSGSARFRAGSARGAENVADWRPHRRFAFRRRVTVRFRVDAGFRVTRSGSLRAPVSRFHSSNVCGEIFPFTRSSANLRRWAWLLNGIRHITRDEFPAVSRAPQAPSGWRFASRARIRHLRASAAR
jgi:hypothetical protein